MSYIDGLATGLDTTSIISQLMKLEAIPRDRLTSRMNLARSASTELDALRVAVAAIARRASEMKSPASWQPLQASSSHPSVTATASSGMQTGQLSFRVTQLATAHSMYSSTTVASLDAPIAASGSIFSHSGTDKLGIGSLTASGIAPGTIAFAVTQSSSAAVTVASGLPQPVPLPIDGTNNELVVDLKGATAVSLSLGTGEYGSAQELAAALNAAIAASPEAAGQIRAGVSGDGALQLTTIAEGAAETVTVVGGSAAAVLGWNLTEGTAAGQDGIIEIDGQAYTVAPIAGETLAVSVNGGTLTVDIAGNLRAGTASVAQKDFGTGTLAEVISTINGSSGLGYRATAVNTGNGYRLQLTATSTGAASTMALDPDLLAIGGGLIELTPGQDAQITLEGTNPLAISSPGNTFDNVIPGVSVTVSELTAGPVTVGAARDTDAVKTSITELVTELNALFTRIKKNTQSDPGSGTRALLSGDAAARRAQNDLMQAMIRPVDGNAIISAGAAGITLERDGTFRIDEAALAEALERDPEALMRLFTSPPGDAGPPGILERLEDAANAASRFGSGYLATAKESRDSQVRSFNRQIDAYTVRLELREAAMRRQYAALEQLMGSLSSQSNWLAGQLGSLSTGS